MMAELPEGVKMWRPRMGSQGEGSQDKSAAVDYN